MIVIVMQYALTKMEGLIVTALLGILETGNVVQASIILISLKEKLSH